LYFIADIVLLTKYSPNQTPPPGLEGIELLELQSLMWLFLLWPVLTTYWASGFLGGLAVDRRWCRRAWQGIAIGLALAAVVQSFSGFFVGTLLYGPLLGTAKLKTMWSVWSFLPIAVVSNIGWALGIFLVSDADLLLQNEETKPEIVSLAKESLACTPKTPPK
jgi:hypothetical protein